MIVQRAPQSSQRLRTKDTRSNLSLAECHATSVNIVYGNCFPPRVLPFRYYPQQPPFHFPFSISLDQLGYTCSPRQLRSNAKSPLTFPPTPTRPFYSRHERERGRGMEEITIHWDRFGRLAYVSGTLVLEVYFAIRSSERARE